MICCNRSYLTPLRSGTTPTQACSCIPNNFHHEKGLSVYVTQASFKPWILLLCLCMQLLARQGGGYEALSLKAAQTFANDGQYQRQFRKEAGNLELVSCFCVTCVLSLPCPFRRPAAGLSQFNPMGEVNTD